MKQGQHCEETPCETGIQNDYSAKLVENLLKISTAKPHESTLNRQEMTAQIPFEAVRANNLRAPNSTFIKHGCFHTTDLFLLVVF